MRSLAPIFWRRRGSLVAPASRFELMVFEARTKPIVIRYVTSAML